MLDAAELPAEEALGKLVTLAAELVVMDAD